MTIVPRGLAVALLILVLLAVPAAAATVTVRVEGASKTVVRAVQVQPSASVVVDKRADGGTTCDGTSGGGALELATKGDWTGRADQFGQRVERIADETYRFEDGRFWSLWINNKTADTGICGFTPQEGDEILLAPACAGATTDCFTGDPLDLRAPATASPGTAFNVSVDEYTNTFDPNTNTTNTTKTPSAGATVSGGGQTATTGADGTAAVTLTERGPAELVVTKDGRVRDEATVCVTDGADGACGTTATTPAPPCETDGHDGRCGSRDTDVAQAAITGVREGRRFAAGRGPRTLSGRVAADPSGLLMVKLR